MTKIIFSLFLIIFSGCARSTHTASGFLEDYYRLRPGAFFQQEFVASGVDFSDYGRVQVKPLSMRFLPNRYTLTKDELEELNRIFFHEFAKHYGGRFQFVSPKGRAKKNTVVIEPAITVLNPPEKMVNVLAPLKRGETAFEVRLKQGGTNYILFEAAELSKGSPQGTALLRGAYSKFSDARESVEYWAKKLAVLMDSHSK